MEKKLQKYKMLNAPAKVVTLTEITKQGAARVEDRWGNEYLTDPKALVAIGRKGVKN